MDKMSVNVEEGGHAVIVYYVIVPDLVIEGAASVKSGGCPCASEGAGVGGECSYITCGDCKKCCDSTRVRNHFSAR